MNRLDLARCAGDRLNPFSASRTDFLLSQLNLVTDFAGMVADAVGNVTTGELEEALETLWRLTLTFATMCHGTEALLVAMEEIKRAVKDRRAVILRYKHLFNVEIESHGQAHIEPNFNPDILFKGGEEQTKLLHVPFNDADAAEPKDESEPSSPRLQTVPMLARTLTEWSSMTIDFRLSNIDPVDRLRRS
ncbi:MAG: hypothetical protein Q9184_004323 [Pyrenodesmia sp. 2 TL-2023]